MMFDPQLITDLREASDAAWRKIGFDPNRIRELDDEDLRTLGAHAVASRFIAEAGLMAKAGCDGAAKVALVKVEKRSHERLVALVQRAQKATDPTLDEWAALVIDALSGIGAVTVEMERRRAPLN